MIKASSKDGILTIVIPKQKKEIEQVKLDLKEKYEWTDEHIDYYVKSGGLTIYTTQDTDIQNFM